MFLLRAMIAAAHSKVEPTHQYELHCFILATRTFSYSRLLRSRLVPQARCSANVAKRGLPAGLPGEPTIYAERGGVGRCALTDDDDLRAQAATIQQRRAGRGAGPGMHGVRGITSGPSKSKQ